MTIKYLSGPLGKLLIAYLYIHMTVSFIYHTPSNIINAVRTAWVGCSVNCSMIAVTDGAIEKHGVVDKWSGDMVGDSVGNTYEDVRVGELRW
jgi:hypothetical protein